MGRKKKFVLESTADLTLPAMLSAIATEGAQEFTVKCNSAAATMAEVNNSTSYYKIKEAYKLLKDAMGISFRAFSGRIERKKIQYVKIGKRRYLSREVVDLLLYGQKEYYSIKEAHEKLSTYAPELNIRALIGRVEQESIPSVKLGGRRLLPRVYIDKYSDVLKTHFDVADAYSTAINSGLKISRSAFERRLDRGRIPHVKIGGKRYLPKAVVSELLQKELHPPVPAAVP
ncbi:hypothetical protein COT30_02300 [Candidatus Micrarchaeota archaeon CG08_land_8_20_14_0_20_49_17]|nr:MAG: hypothetical protein AUJ13_04515 [Candidatus Micrarchaeota archaeon CG1_02_49_24]PIU09849.1 MAG: hypothetical protein COT30_02300 [Candidatus Micrarchaeota archaeon CG08_land_8_20_14_0_20_49_17]PIU82546.1 MAG: hypothetical protein COS70_00730 [Candidatus Micrarchaeota archaeon CG06_land_8_20_14_3_00_50_6]PIZ95460.1 MAG: hypothetical protein COX84_04485 [Candidatus Micrarchaeota archaeon CG_4_10_14_0_2_um_filter_49_7]HII53767.1 helix-turn-helix domain-containing protein [Candidatus Micra